ncbi:MAG: hypothetical protein FJZ43_04430 [Candidatus Staskawiczbacteria bacterium]|nr:hypothetical protein [Candidatus Staskawiczbacteria bacterium]
MKKVMTFLGAFLVASILLTSCGGGNANNKKQSGTEAPAENNSENSDNGSLEDNGTTSDDNGSTSDFETNTETNTKTNNNASEETSKKVYRQGYSDGQTGYGLPASDRASAYEFYMSRGYNFSSADYYVYEMGYNDGVYGSTKKY